MISLTSTVKALRTINRFLSYIPRFKPKVEGIRFLQYSLAVYKQTTETVDIFRFMLKIRQCRNLCFFFTSGNVLSCSFVHFLPWVFCHSSLSSLLLCSGPAHSHLLQFCHQCRCFSFCSSAQVYVHPLLLFLGGLALIVFCLLLPVLCRVSLFTVCLQFAAMAASVFLVFVDKI